MINLSGSNHVGFLASGSGMPIDRLLQNSKLEPAVQKALRLAFIRALRLLGLVDRNDPDCEIVACKIVEIGAIGASDPIAISDIAVRQLSAFIADRKKPVQSRRDPLVDR